MRIDDASLPDTWGSFSSPNVADLVVFGIGLLTAPGEGEAVILVTLETVGGRLDRQA